MKIFNKEEHLNHINLTSLMTISELFKKNKISNDNNVNLLLREYLKEFGILVVGETSLRFEDNRESNTKVKCVTLSTNIPSENLSIIPLLYGWNNCKVNINLRGFDTHSDAIEYFTSSGKCNLTRHVYGSSEVVGEFDSLSELMVYYKEYLKEN